MKIKLLSDLHLEGRYGYETKTHPWSYCKGEDVLVLAGDIAVGAEKVIQAIDYFLNQGFPEIVYVMGNHECYHHNHRSVKDKIKRALADMTKVHLLDANEIVKIQDVSFFGGTLWTNFGGDPIAKSAARYGINDFRVIDDWTVDAAETEYGRQLDFIKTAARQTDGKKVIVTHFLPAQELVAERFKSLGIDNLLNKYFANNLSDWISYQSNTTWLFGHTHDAMDVVIGETHCISNPLGYSRETIPEFAKFNPDLVIEV
jgi:predicted phosphodiesterase